MKDSPALAPWIKRMRPSKHRATDVDSGDY
jgi:hypothetical protein